MADRGGARPALSYIERMKRLKAKNDRLRAEQFGMQPGAMKSGGDGAAPSSSATSSTEPRRRPLEERPSSGHQPSEDDDRGKENSGEQLNESHRVNKTAPAGDVSVMSSSLLSTSGDGLRSSISLLSECSGASGAPGASDVSKNSSHGSSVVDMPRASHNLQEQNSLLASFSARNTTNDVQLESFSMKPPPTLPPQRRQLSSVLESIDRQDGYGSRPRDTVPREESRDAVAERGGSSAEQEGVRMRRGLSERKTSDGEAMGESHRATSSSSRPESMIERSGRSAIAANGSILRSKSAVGLEPPLATPAFARSGSVLSALGPRTPGLFQTPSMLRRMSMSATSLSHSQRMVVNEKEYAILNQIGKGGSSTVFQGFDEETGTTVAIKVVDLSDADESSREVFVNEVELLKGLQGSRHVIKMYDYELVEDGSELLVVMEKGDTDLATYLKTRRNEITPTFLRYWWEEMLRAVQFVHQQNVVHMDLKPANFLLVSGNLKLIDFGIASSIPTNKTSVMKETQMGTLSYMSPESLAAEHETMDDETPRYKVTAKSDVWSLGCIFYTMVYGRSPFEHFRQMRAKVQAIINPATSIFYDETDDPLIVDVLKRCLVHDVKKRASVNELLDHPYLKGTAAPTTTGPPATPVRASPISEEALAALALKIQSYTPRTTTRKLQELVRTVQQKNGGDRNPQSKQRTLLTFDSPPSTK